MAVKSLILEMQQEIELLKILIWLRISAVQKGLFNDILAYFALSLEMKRVELTFFSTDPHLLFQYIDYSHQI